MALTPPLPDRPGHQTLRSIVGEPGPPGVEAVMWCHHCETYQLRSAMPILTPSWCPEGGPMRCCVHCGEDEPEGPGVWAIDVDDLDACEWEHARRQDSLYPGDWPCCSRR